MEDRYYTEKETPSPPKDKHNLVFWIAFLIGFTILLPWNILITVTGFWDYKFRNISRDERNETLEDEEGAVKTDLQKLFASYVAIASNVPNATFIILHAIIGHRFSMKIRLYGSQIGMIVILAFITLIAILDSSEWQNLFLTLSLIGIVFINAFSAVFQGGVGSLLSPFPHEYLGHWVNGAGFGGLLPSIINVIIIAASQDPETSGIACFLFALVITCICLIMTYVMEKSEFYQFYYAKLQENVQTTTKEKLPLRTDEKNIISISQQMENNNDNFLSRMKRMTYETVNIYLNLGVSVWHYMFITLLNFTVTLCVFPAVCGLAESYDTESDGDWSKFYFVAVCCFVVFNIADYVGKQLAVWIQKPGPSKWGQLSLLVSSILRIGFIPLFMFCNVSVNNRETNILIHSDAAYIVLMVLFGISNGYIGNIAMMFGPGTVKDPKYGETAAAAIVAVLVIGCGVGSVISNALVRTL